LYQIKNLHSKGNTYQNKETAYRIGEKFASYSSDKRLLFRIYKEFKKLNSKRINNPINKWADELNTVLKQSTNDQ
jgi:hypothetical protein